MSYVSISDFREYSGGVDLSNYGDDELSIVLAASSSLCDAETNTEWSFKTVFEEPHDWGQGATVRWEGYPYYTPVRVITGFAVATALNPTSGGFYTVSIPTTPIGPPDLPKGQLPTNFGQVWLDRQRDIVVTTYTLLQYGLAGQFFPVGPLTPPQLLLSYTAGYDDGSITGITVQNGGSGYTTPPTVTIDPSPVMNSNATATATISNGQVTGIVVTSAGGGYTNVPNITISGGGGTGAVATAQGQSDGLLVPAPSWLRESCRLVAGAMIAESNLAAQGLAGIQMVRQGQTDFRRGTESQAANDFTIPTEVRNLLRTHRKTVIV